MKGKVFIGEELQNDMIDQVEEKKTYYHLRGTTLMDSPIDGFGSHPFYEGTVSNNGRDTLFFLRKFYNDTKSLAQIGLVLSEIELAMIDQELSQDTGVLGHQRYEHFQESVKLFEKHGVPEKLWRNNELAASQALCNRFGRDADIVVPGYVAATTVSEHGAIISEIDIIPAQDRPEIKRKLRERGMEGVLSFW
jgi:hypothetical protein